MTSREDMIEQSTQDFAREALEAKGYENFVTFVDAFPYTAASLPDEVHDEGVLKKNIVAVGFNFDDEGEAAECGSDLIRRVYTIQFVTFGRKRVWAKNIANLLKFALDPSTTGLPLKDIEVEGQPVVDHLQINGVSAHREIIPEPEPYQENVYSTIVTIQDEYSAALTT